jgi:hypothetical protein
MDPDPPPLDATKRALSQIERDRRSKIDDLRCAHEGRVEAAKAARASWKKEVERAADETQELLENVAKSGWLRKTTSGRSIRCFSLPLKQTVDRNTGGRSIRCFSLPMQKVQKVQKASERWGFLQFLQFLHLQTRKTG